MTDLNARLADAIERFLNEEDDDCWHCNGTGKVVHCDHEWTDLPQRGIRMCWLCGRPEDLA